MVTETGRSSGATSSFGGSDVSPQRSSVDAEARRAERWRGRLLPLMTRMLVGLTIFFFTVSLGQIAYLHWHLEQSPSADLAAPMAVLTDVAAGRSNGTQAAAAMIAARLEANALDRRYHQASIVLMARVWTSYLGFVTGMILSLVGAAFTLGRVHEVQTSIEGKAGAVSGTLQTAAPGMVLTVLGVVLMIATLFVPYGISVSDGAIYSSGLGGRLSEPATPPSPPPFPSTPVSRESGKATH